MTKHKLNQYFLMIVIGTTCLRTIVYSGVIGAIDPYTIVWNPLMNIYGSNGSTDFPHLRGKFILDESYEASSIIRYKTRYGYLSYTLYFYPKPVKNVKQIDRYDHFNLEITSKMNYVILMYALNECEDKKVNGS